jgi:hypothetical protein
MGSVVTTVLLMGGSAVAQSDPHRPGGPTQRADPRGIGPGMMPRMARTAGADMGPGMMMQNMGCGMHSGMGPGMMRGGIGLTGTDPAQIQALKSELGITAAQESVWTIYAKAIEDTANATKTAADELLAALDDTQKVKARTLLPGLASVGPGMRSALPGPELRH